MRKFVSPRRLSPRHLIIAAFLSISLVTNARDASGQVQTKEYSLKASFLSLFGEFVQWENQTGLGTSETLTLGVLGSDPFEAVMAGGRRFNHLDARVGDRVAKGRKIVIRRIASPAKYQPCDILYISRDVAENSQAFQATLAVTQNANVLLVGDTPGLAQKGVAINMVIDAARNRIVLQINPDAAKRAGLTVNRKLYEFPGVEIVRD